MKSIKISNFHHIPFLMKLLILIGLPICLCFLVIGIIKHSIGLILIGTIPLISAIIGLGFFFSYGIKITSKKVILINQRMLKIFPYEDVIYIKIVFRNDNIEGEIKAKNQKTYLFCFDGIDLSLNASFLSYLWISGLKLTKEFVEKSIASLSACEKVKIENFYTSQEK